VRRSYDADEVRYAGLEQLIARVGLEHREHGLAVVARRIEPEMLDHALDLAAQYRNVPRAAEVGGRGPESEEAMLAVDAPAGVEGLDADVVEQLTAMHGGGRVRLGQDQQLRLAPAGAHVTAQHRDARTAAAAACFAQDSESRAHIGHEAVFAAAALETVVTIAEKDEVPRLHPIEQVRRLAHLGRRQRRRIALEATDDLACALAHRHPVADRAAHVGEGRLQVPLQARELRGVGDAIDLVQLPRFRMRRVRAVRADVEQLTAPVAAHHQHRVHDQVHRELGPAEGHAQRVDEKRHVVGDREHERMRRLEAIGLRLRVEDAHQRAARCAAGAELEMGECCARELSRCALGQVLFRHAVKIGAQETLSQVVAPADPRGDARNALDECSALGRDAVEQVVIVSSNRWSWRAHT
jgi:hypothetical protein